jgi:hypothetical protein
LIRQLWRKVQYDLSLPEDVEFTVDMDPINAR